MNSGALKSKRDPHKPENKTFVGKDGLTYMVFRRQDREDCHVFAETEGKEAARQCGATREGTTWQMWESIWWKENDKSY
jgi:hypothetical protein